MAPPRTYMSGWDTGVEVHDDSEYSETDDEDDAFDPIYAPARPGKTRCPDYWTSMLKFILRTCNGRIHHADGWIASAGMTCVFLGSLGIIGKPFWVIPAQLITDGEIHAAHASRAINDITFGLTLLLLCLVWHSLSFRNKDIKAVWAAEKSLIGSVMTGGFFPRPAAASMGLLLFVQGNMLKTSTCLASEVKGKGHESCVANSAEIDEFPAAQWFQRFHRKLARGCFGMPDHQPYALAGLIQRDTFLVSDFNESMAHPVVDGIMDMNKYCTYSCSKFESLAVSQVVKSIGSIFAGAGVVVTVCDYLTTHLGWELLTKASDARSLIWAVLGVRMPSPADLEHAMEDYDFRDEMILKLQSVHPRKPGSPLMAAVQLMFIFWFAQQITPLISINGYFTVDYYTTLLMATSALISMTLRLWNPYSCRSVTFTRNLWTKGEDCFFEFNPHHKAFEKKVIDLYDWVHIPAVTRGQYLLHYCRAIGDDVFSKYNKKGFIPELEVEHEELKQDTDSHHGHVTGITETICIILSTLKHGIRWILCPLCHKKQEAKAAVKKSRVTTIAEIHVEWEFETWKVGKSGEPLCDKMLHSVVISSFVTGTVTKLSKKAGEVVVFFPPRQDGRASCFYLGEGAIVTHDEQQYITNKVFPPNSGDGWELSVPVGAIQMASKEWSFARILLGEKSGEELRLGR